MGHARLIGSSPCAGSRVRERRIGGHGEASHDEANRGLARRVLERRVAVHPGFLGVHSFQRRTERPRDKHPGLRRIEAHQRLGPIVMSCHSLRTPTRAAVLSQLPRAQDQGLHFPWESLLLQATAKLRELGWGEGPKHTHTLSITGRQAEAKAATPSSGGRRE